MTPIKSYFLYLILMSLPIQMWAQGSESAVANLVNGVSYGVPSSPAFELLPGKTSEVVNLVTPHDIASNVNNLFDGTKIRTGAAFDARPFAWAVGSITQYQENKALQFLYRSLLSIGTAPDDVVKGDVFLSTGLRIPIFDNGDPRAKKDFLRDLSTEAQKIVIAPDLELSDEENINRSEAVAKAKKLLDPIRDKFYKENWNRGKLDAGFAYMVRARSGSLQTDSLSGDRLGLWVAWGIRLRHFGQLTVSGKLTNSLQATKAESETGRNVLGARARFFFPGKLADRLAASAEFAGIWANYKESSMNESWRHFAVLVEYHLPKLKGWLGVGYGGDTAHRTNSDSKFSINYAIYTNQLIKK
ncbi:hypothetical protein [Spirosoma litoris]